MTEAVLKGVLQLNLCIIFGFAEILLGRETKRVVAFDACPGLDSVLEWDVEGVGGGEEAGGVRCTSGSLWVVLALDELAHLVSLLHVGNEHLTSCLAQLHRLLPLDDGLVNALSGSEEPSTLRSGTEGRLCIVSSESRVVHAGATRLRI